MPTFVRARVPFAGAVAAAFWLCAGAPSWALCLGICTCDVSAQATAFTYNPFSAAPKNVSSGEVSVHCSANVSVLFSYTVKLSRGGAASYATRRMVSGANQLSYQIYDDSGRTTIWGDGTAGTGFISNSYLLSVLNPSRTDHFPVYVSAPGSQNVKAGTYQDTITVTLEY
jgi:spore coat protein U-like protein